MTPKPDAPVPAIAGFRFAMLSDVGRVRSGNEDFCAATPDTGVFVVCDGMGGAAAGEVASRLAAETFLERVNTRHTQTEVTEALLQAAVTAANRAVRQLARMEPGKRGMGTTLVALAFEQNAANSDGSLWLAHIGDSRCYRWRAGKLDAMTIDHSLVQEQILAGQITPEQAEQSPVRNIITRAIGSAPEVQAEVRQLAPLAGDVYLLCSDGLTRELPDEAIARRLLAQTGVAGDGDLEAGCAALIEAANAAGGRDNVTSLLLRIRDDSPEEGLH